MNLKKSISLLLVLAFYFSCKKEVKRAEDIALLERKLSNLLVSKSENVPQGSREWFAILDSAISINPLNASAYREKSVWFTKTGDYVKSFSLLDKAAELDPQDALGYRGWLKLYKLHDYKGAIKDFKNFDSLSVETASAWGENVLFLIGIGEKQLANYDTAINYFTKYIDQTKTEIGEEWVDPYAFIYRGICYSNMGKYEKSLSDFNKALRYCNTCSEAYWQKSKTYFKMSLLEEGCEELSYAIRYVRYIKTDPYKELFDQPNYQMYMSLKTQYCND